MPGTLPTDATSIFEEGVVIPPVKLYKKGELQEDLLTLILNQVRLPQWNRSDLNAIVAACRTAGVRIIGLSDHTVSHSLYVLDPDGNELELYIDVPGVDWKNNPAAVMAPTRPLTL